MRSGWAAGMALDFDVRPSTHDEYAVDQSIEHEEILQGRWEKRR